ncbi:hypothetical protein FZEAL_1884, partial [Fusarium zealandicum]
MSRLRKILPILSFVSSSPSSSISSTITPAPDLDLLPIGPGSDHLLSELESLYWEGVKAELENIVRTLKVWQQPEYSDVSVKDEEDGHIHGFDTFLDQGVEQRAWMLLQAAGFLDMERLIEHRPPLEDFKFWKRPAIPQLALSKFDESWIPRFQPMHCMRPECSQVIRGSMFVTKSQKDPGLICEECYRKNYYGRESYIKAYKHSILAESITPEASRKMCHCEEVPHFDSNGRPIDLYPVDKDANHFGGGGNGDFQCTLFKLGWLVSLAKYDGLQTSVGAKKQGTHYKPAALPKTERLISHFRAKSEAGAPQKVSSWKPKQMKQIEHTALRSIDSTATPSSTSSVATEAQADQDIPLLFRQYTEKYPFGNVHMALRVGPLVIENGVSHTKGGALVSLREMPIFHERFHLQTMPERNLAVAGSPDRTVWKRKRQTESLKRYKAIMKQVVGVPFSGSLDHEKELEIVQDILTACKQPFDDSGLPASDQIKLLNSVLDPAMGKLKLLLGSRLKIYLGSIANRLLDENVKLAWSATDNNCQMFCGSLLDRSLFEPFLNGEASQTNEDAYPLYNMSFVCPDEGYRQRNVRSKFDVPFGLTEEYLLRFHFGRHDEADIIDTYQEYWYDWGDFGGTLYPYQDLFPWDCTEAYNRYPTKCGDCNLAKHVWAFPFDSWSMSSLHLARDRHMYGPATTDKNMTAVGEGASPSSWMRNRLTVLSAVSALNRGATAMARTRELQQATQWLHKTSTRPDLDPSVVRVKLGGIHRAQPLSHYFEAGRYCHYFIAPWATWPRPVQIEAYELLRDIRISLPDVARDRWKPRFPDPTCSERTPKVEDPFFPGFGFDEQQESYDIWFPPQTSHDMDDLLHCFADSHFDPVDAPAASFTCASGCGSATCGGGDCGSVDVPQTSDNH